jgi:nucleoside-diphosphate-sugar epimerase
MRALVTGSAGFIGRHMVAELRRRGYGVVASDLKNGADVRYRFRDPYDPRDEPFDLVVHCAYHVGGRAAIDGEPRMLARNLELDAQLFDWAVRTGQGRVLYFSSSAAYPVGLQSLEDRVPLHEEYVTLGGLDGLGLGGPDARYGWAKLTGEHLARAARESGLPVTICRPFSGYGEDQDDAYPFRAIVERARRRSDPFEIWGPGTQVRDWIHVDDVVAGALAVVESGTSSPVNLCTGRGVSMLELARMCCAQVGYTTPEFAPQPDKPTGVAYRVGDPTRFHKFWTPRVSLEDGVARALASVPA